MNHRSAKALSALPLLVAIACGGSEPPPAAPVVAAPPPEPIAEETAPPPAAAPVKLTTRELVLAHDACWDNYFGKKDEAALANCMTDSSVEEEVDQGMPPRTGIAANVQSTKEFWAAFPDLSGEQLLTLAKGNTIAILGRMGGTNTASFMGQPPTNKPVSLYGVEIVEATDDGKHGTTRVYYDAATFMGQLGMAPGPHRALVDKTSAPRKLVIANGDEHEAQILARAAQCVESWNQSDWKAFDECFTPDVMLVDATAPTDFKGKKAIDFLKGIKKAFSDGKLTARNQWAAGDYAVFEQTFTGTNKAAAPQLGIKKATNKAVETHFVQIMRVEGDKIAEAWELGNGMAMAMQLGLVPPPGAPKAPAQK